MASEDTIKRDVRNDLRTLRLTKRQYQISVASAALAFERVNSTRLELQLGFAGIAARDFLEAQDAYILALSEVADNRIVHIISRAQLFLDLELVDVGSDGFWYGIYDENQQPAPSHQIPMNVLSTYCDLPSGIKYSRSLRSALTIPVAPPPCPPSDWQPTVTARIEDWPYEE
jgi:hypothetical protein